MLNIILPFKLESAESGLTSTPASKNGTVIVCSGELVSLTCTHNNTKDNQTRWETLNSESNSLALHGEPLRNSQSFGPFSFIYISDGSGLPLNSTAQANVNESLNGSVVLCRAGGSTTDPEEGRVAVLIVGMFIHCVRQYTS